MPEQNQSFKDKVKEYLYIVFISISGICLLCCFIFWYFFPNFYNDNKGIFSYLKSLSTTTLGAGVFTAIIKYFQFMGIYKNEINNIISSSEFEEKLTKVIQNNPYSIALLKGRQDINQIWKNSTLCMFESEYPEISETIKNKLSNAFFDGDSLDHYYKNYVIRLEISIDDQDFIHLKETSIFTIIRPNCNKKDYHFEYFLDKIDENDNSTKYELHELSLNNKSQDLALFPPLIIPQGLAVEYKQKLNLEGCSEYHISHMLSLVYNINIDNQYSFFCTKTIDSISVSVTMSDNLGCNISTLNFENNLTNPIKSAKFEIDNREVILPNGGFKLFFYKK